MTQPFDAAAFAAKWGDNARRENASSQEHFIDLCRMLGAPTPNEADPAGADYAFEYPAVRTSTGRRGSADVFRRGRFGWEYKGAHGDLAGAYGQLLDYRESLGNPPLLVVSDMDAIEVHTNFTDTASAVRRVALADLAAGGERTAGALRVLRAVMDDPEALRPERSPDEVTPSPPPASPTSRARSASAATTPRPSPTSSTACCSASSPRTSACSRPASSPA